MIGFKSVNQFVKCLILFVTSSLVCSGYADRLMYEGFEELNDGYLTGQSGWSQFFGGGHMVVGESSAIEGAKGIIGTTDSWNTANISSSLSFNLATDDITLYIASLVSYTGEGARWFCAPNTGANNGAEIEARIGSAGCQFAGLYGYSNSVTPTWQAGKTYLTVFKIETINATQLRASIGVFDTSTDLTNESALNYTIVKIYDRTLANYDYTHFAFGSINLTTIGDSLQVATDWASLFAAPPYDPEIDYYVSTTGSDDNPGTLAEPFKTIQKAASIVQPGYTVYLRGGTYRETVTPKRSGKSGLPITFMPYNNETVIISGCDLVTSWVQHSGNIWKATCDWDGGANGKGNTVFVDGDLKYEAREFAENNIMDIDDWGYIANGKMTSDYFISDEIKGYGDDYWNGGTVRHHVNDWGITNSTIADYDSATGKITFEESAGVISQKHAFGFYITHPDMTKTLDKPGEWFKEKDVDLLYYYVETGQNPNTLQIENKRRGYGFNLSGLDYIQIKGVDFRGCSIKTDSGTDYNFYQGCKFNGYDKDYDGRLGINGNYNIFRDNEISECWSNGMSLNGVGNQIINNYFHDINFEGVARVFSMAGSDHVIYRNTARNFARGFVAAFPERCEFSYNLIENGARLSWDTADFDADLGAGTGGSCVVHHNLMRCPDSLGNYHAFYSGANITFHHNIIYDWPEGYSLVHGSRKNFVKYIHNTFIGEAPALSSAQNTLSKVEQANYTNNLQLTIDNIATIGVNCRGNYDYSLSDFIDFNNDDYRLVAGSNAIDAGIVLPGFNDGYAGAAPDAGALEYGQAMWEVGHDFDNPPASVSSWTPLTGTNLFTNGQFINAPTGWTYYAGTPIWFFGNAWNTNGMGLSRLGLYCMQLNPGDGMSRTFTGLKPDTWYTVGNETRLTNQLIDCQNYSDSQGTITSAEHRGEDYITGLVDGDWVCYDNVDFGSVDTYNQLSATFTRPRGSEYNPDPASIEVRLGSVSGQLLGEIDFTLGAIDSWLSSECEIPSLSGIQTLCLVFRGESVEQIMLTSIRFQNTNIEEDNKLTIGIRDHGNAEVTSQVGYANWNKEFEKFTFKTGESSTSAELFIKNNGVYDAYFDQMGVWEQDPITYDQRDLVKTDAIVTSGSNFWQAEFVQAINIGKIEVFNVDNDSYRELSNFKVSAWSDDPADGGLVLWEKAFWPTDTVARDGSFVVTGNEISSDGITRLASVLPKFIRIENNGTNAAGNTNLTIKDVSILNQIDSPPSDNIAPTGLAKQSSNYYSSSGHAEDAINNLISPRYDFTSTQSLSKSWWQVDLMQTPTIDQIVIFTRTGADSRLGNFRVSLWDGDPQNSGTEVWGKDYSYPTDINEDQSLTITGDTTSGGKRLDELADARFVFVQLYGTNFLHLSEVQVWQEPFPAKVADFNYDGQVNMIDYSYISACWLDVADVSGSPIMQAYWPLEEETGSVVGDISGNSYDGTAYNKPSWVSGKIGNALSFDGYNDYVKINDSDICDGMTAMTVAAWIKPDTKGDNEGIFTCTDPGNNHYFALLFSGGGVGNPLEFRAMRNSLLAPDNSGPAGVWTHVVGVWKSGQIQKLYINGQLAATSPNPPSGTVDMNDWYIGTDRLGSNRYFDGIIDDVRLYPAALTEVQVSELYNSQAGQWSCKQVDLIQDEKIDIADLVLFMEYWLQNTQQNIIYGAKSAVCDISI